MEPTDGSMAFACHGEWEKANKSNYLWEHFIKVEPGTRERGSKASELWEHFIKVNSEAQCKYCSKMCKRTKGNTSTMRAHLRTKHPYEYAYYLRESRGRNNMEYSEVTGEKEQYGEKEIDDAGVSTELQQSPSPEQSAASTSYIAPEEAPSHEEEQLAPARHEGKYQQSEPQPAMHNFLNLKEESFERCSRSVAYFIATEAMPTSIVDSGGFRAMLEVLRPGFGSSCPSRHAMMETYIPRLYNDTQKTVEDILRTAEWYAVTCDSWTSETKLPYLAVTVNFITKEWTLENLCLESFVQDDSHSGRHLCEAIKVVLQDWGVSPSFFSAITTDNGISVTSAARMMDVPHISCFAHSLQIAVEKIYNDDDVREVITKVQQMQALFSASYNLRRDLLLEAEKQGKRGRLLPSVSPTQWWSTLHLIQAVVEQDVLLHAVLTREEYVKKNYCQLLLSSREVNLLIAVLSVLNPLEDICEHMSGETYITASALLPLVELIIEKKIELDYHPEGWYDAAYDEVRTRLLRVIQASLGERYLGSSWVADHLPGSDRETRQKVGENIARDKMKTFLQVSTFLDPRFKFNFTKERDQACVKKLVIEELRISKELPMMGETSSLEVPSMSSSQEPPKKLRGLAALFSSKQPVPAEERSPDQVVEAQIEAYLCTPPTSMAESPLLWWKIHEGDFPHLAKLAKKYLPVQGTSAPPERVFSSGGRIIRDERSCLFGENSSMLIFLSMNRRLIPKLHSC